MDTKVVDQAKLDLDVARCQGQWQSVQHLVYRSGQFTEQSVLERTAQLEVDLIQLVQNSRLQRDHLQDEPDNVTPPPQLFPYEVTDIQQQLEAIVHLHSKPTLTTPDDWQAQLTRIILARVYYESGQYERAIQQLQKLALRLEDVSEGYGFVLLIQARVIKGISLEMMGQLSGALDAFDSACTAMDEHKNQTGVTLASWIEDGLYRAIMVAVRQRSPLAVKFMRFYTQLSSTHWSHQWRVQKQWVIFKLYTQHLIQLYQDNQYPHTSTDRDEIQKAAFNELFILMNRFRGLIRAYASKLTADQIDPFITEFINMMFLAHDTIGWGQISHIRRVRQFFYHANTITFNNPSIPRGLFYTLLRLGHYEEAKYALRTYFELIGLPDALEEESVRGPLTLEDKLNLIKAKLHRSFSNETNVQAIQVIVTGAQFYARDIRKGDFAIQLANIAVGLADDSDDNDEATTVTDKLMVQCHRVRGVAYGLLAAQSTDPEERAAHQKESLMSLEIAVTLDREQWQTFYELAYQQLQMRDCKGAASSISQALKLNPNHLPSWILLALIYTSQQKVAEALTTLEHALNDSQATERLMHLDTFGAPAMSWTGEANCLDVLNSAESLVQMHMLELSCIAKLDGAAQVLPQLSDLFSLYSVLTTHLGIAELLELEKDPEIVLPHHHPSSQQSSPAPPSSQQQRQQTDQPRKPSIKQITTISSPVHSTSHARLRLQQQQQQLPSPEAEEASSPSPTTIAPPDFTRRLPSGGSLMSFSSNPALLENIKSRPTPVRSTSLRGMPETKSSFVRRGSQSLKKSLYQLESSLGQRRPSAITPNASAILVNGTASNQARRPTASSDFSLASVLSPSLSMASMRSQGNMERSASFMSVLGTEQMQEGRQAYTRNNFLHYQRDRWNSLLVKIWLFATDMFTLAGQFEEANKALIETEMLAPGVADVWGQMGQLCVQAMGKLATSPENGKYVWTKAQWRLREMAMEAFRKALTLDEEHVDSHIALAEQLTHVKEWELAEGHLDRVTRAHGWDHAQAWCALGQIYQQQQQLERAKQCFFYALDLNDTNPIQPLSRTVPRFA
ncbi:hypothetical protein BC940DRAFT_324010 [Gongronella butleri]|nr:hypothetical protein BC940DRAFT_324010 [Gongronella butleri]